PAVPLLQSVAATLSIQTEPEALVLPSRCTELLNAECSLLIAGCWQIVHGLRSARDFPRSSAARLVLARGGKAFPYPARDLLPDSVTGRRSRRQALRSLRRQSFTHRSRQGFPRIRRTNAGLAQGHACNHRGNGAHPP